MNRAEAEIMADLIEKKTALARRISELETEVGVLKQIVAKYEAPMLSVHAIQRVVAQDFGIALPDLLSPRRTKHLVTARHFAMYLTARLLPRYSLPAIARHFGGRDHTTVMHARDKIQRDRESDIEIDVLLTRLEERLNLLRPRPTDAAPEQQAA